MRNYPELMKKVNVRVGDMENSVQTWRSHWAEIRDYISPWSGRGLTGKSDSERNDGSKKHSKVFDSSPERGLGTMAAGLQSGLTSPARPWFKLALDDTDLMNYKPVAQWLYEVERRMRLIFSKSNLYDSLHQGYKELGAFGTSAMLIKEDFNSMIRTRAFTIGEYMLESGEDGTIDTFYRETHMTARQVVQTFGEDNVSRKLMDRFKQAPDTVFTICNLIEPNDSRMKIVSVGQRPWRSLYWEKGNCEEQRFLSIRGFNNFPIAAPRWELLGRNVYGYGPGMTILPDAKMLMKMQKKSIVALDKMVDPPLVAPGKHKNRNINTIPGGVTFDPTMETGAASGIRALYQVNPNIQAIEYKIERVQQAIREGLFNDLFKMLASLPDNHQMTATEVAERHQEKLLMLGPVLERLHSEQLDPIINITFDIMDRNDALPPIPPELEGKDLRVEYISILAQAQKAISITAINQFTGFVGNLAAVKPEVLDKYNADEAVDEFAEATGIPPKMVKSKEEVDAIRQQRAEQERMQQMLETANQAAQGAETLSRASTEDNNVLGQLMGNLQQ
jgi:hypothetical protein